jgi:pseudouridine kinase
VIRYLKQADLPAFTLGRGAGNPLSHQEHVLVIGAANMDIKGRPAAKLVPGSSTPGSIQISQGGVARNIAENLARLEVDTVLLTSVGDDEQGERILAHAASGGIDISEAVVVPGQRTGSYLALLSETGMLDYAVDDMTTMQALTPEYFGARRHLFENARMVAVDANLPLESLSVIVALCRDCGVPLCADPTSTTLAPRLKPYLGNLHMICPNVNETLALCGAKFEASSRDSAQEAALKLVGMGVKIAIITLGEHGVVYGSEETTGHIPAITGSIVDPTGASDAMTAAIIFGLLEDIPLDESVRLGVSAATLTMRSRETVRPDLDVDLLYDQLVI